jgi:hypothetical protein
MRFIVITSLIVLLILGCDNDLDFIELPKDSILHDNGSKVWLIDEIVNSTKNFAPSDLQRKSVIIFYNTYNCVMHPISSLGNKPLKSGNFELSSNNLELTINFHEEKWVFDVLEINNSEVILEPKSNSIFPYKLKLKTFPEF